MRELARKRERALPKEERVDSARSAGVRWGAFVSASAARGERTLQRQAGPDQPASWRVQMQEWGAETEVKTRAREDTLASHDETAAPPAH